MCGVLLSVIIIIFLVKYFNVESANEIIENPRPKSEPPRPPMGQALIQATDEDINTFFDNQIFAYHWHSRNNYKIEKNSYFEKLESLNFLV